MEYPPRGATLTASPEPVRVLGFTEGLNELSLGNRSIELDAAGRFEFDFDATWGVNLLNLTGRIGDVEVEGIDLCRPCRHLTEVLDQPNILKEFLRRGGLRCQILSSSRISVNDEIKIID